jgi:peptidoglycan/LPS O-acetylase OafA/YrhL
MGWDFYCQQETATGTFGIRCPGCIMSTPEREPSLCRDNNFNFLRLFFALLVILSHSVEWKYGDKLHEPLMKIFGTLSFSDVAVNGFFLLSGYLIVQSWLREPILSSYLKKRALRVYPGFMIANLLSVFVVVPFIADAHLYFSRFEMGIFLRSLILLQLPDVPNMFAGASYPFVNAPVWTISYEFRCYIIVALLGMVGLFKQPRLWLALTCLAFCVLAIGYALPSGVMEEVSFPGSSLLIGTTPDFARLFCYFGAGGCCFLFRHRIVYKKGWAWGAVPILLLSLFHPISANLALATLGAYILFWFAFQPIPLLDRFKSGADISYGTYLYGWPVQRLLMFHFPALTPLGLFPLGCLLSALCGAASWRYVERPFLRLKSRG